MDKRKSFTAIAASLILLISIFAYTQLDANVKADSELVTTTPNLKVAFIADQGVTENAYAVLDLIKTEGAELLVINGDLGYEATPTEWNQMMTTQLGESYPLIISIGDHDREYWDEYSQMLPAKQELNSDLDCKGKVGVEQICRYKGLYFVVSGIGTHGDTGRSFISKSLNKSDALWNICTWHRPNVNMHVGKKTESKVSTDTYDVCRNAGAIIATADEHSYSRTYTMSSFAEKITADTNKNQITLTNGQSFTFISGMGGESIRHSNPAKTQNAWWASYYTATENADYGALFCTFNVDGDPKKAKCYFKDIKGVVADEFEIINNR